MNKVLFGALLSIAALLTACADKEPETDTSIKPSDSLTSTSVIAGDTSNTIQTAPVNNFNPGQPVTGSPVTTSPAMQAATQPVAVAAGMNPAHGQPNHRCDIAVGAPLNSPAAKPAAPVMQTTQTINPQPQASGAPSVVATPATTVPTAPGMNPPHGQPNHRCDIAVGAPLNSPVTKPAAQTVTPAGTNAPATITTPVQMTPVKKDSSKK